MGHMQALSFWMIQQQGYGALYNWWAATDARNIAPVGWHVPTDADFELLREFIDPGGSYFANIAGTKLKEIGTTHWLPGNTGTDDYSFTSLGAGKREFTGTYMLITNIGLYWTTIPYDATDSYCAYIIYNLATFYAGEVGIGGFSTNKKEGLSIRLIKDNSNDLGTMTGNDGKIYTTVKIGTQVWMAQNSAETKYRNGNLITVETDDVLWAALVTEARCAYDNDWSNV